MASPYLTKNAVCYWPQGPARGSCRIGQGLARAQSCLTVE